MVQIRTAGSIAGPEGFAGALAATSAPSHHLGSRTIADGLQPDAGRPESRMVAH